MLLLGRIVLPIFLSFMIIYFIPIKREGRLGQGKPTTNANPRPAIKRQILPPDPQAFLLAPIEPALRNEAFCVFSIEVFAPVHGIETPVDNLALCDKDGRFTILPTTYR